MIERKAERRILPTLGDRRKAKTEQNQLDWSESLDWSGVNAMEGDEAPQPQKSGRYLDGGME